MYATGYVESFYYLVQSLDLLSQVDVKDWTKFRWFEFCLEVSVYDYGREAILGKVFAGV